MVILTFDASSPTTALKVFRFAKIFRSLALLKSAMTKSVKLLSMSLSTCRKNTAALTL